MTLPAEPMALVGILGLLPIILLLGLLIKFYHSSQFPAIQFHENSLSIQHFPGFDTETEYREITGAAIIRFQRSERVVVYVKDPAHWMQSQPMAYQSILRWNDRLFQSPLCLSFTFTDSNPVEIMQLFQKHIPHLAGGETFENNR